ncbi:MAG: 3'-5' exonuclease [Labilibaculum sp.]|nr:3'-5' exonuclease [Labilibaculum sp.]
MLHWFKKNKQPAFWKQYIQSFKKQSPRTFENCRFVVFDTETTGLNPKTDRILSIGAIGLKGNCISIADSFDQFLIQNHFNKDTVAIHGILKEGKTTKISEKEALEAFIIYIGNSVLVAHHAAFDLAMINRGLKRMGLPKLKNKCLDTGNLYKKLKEKPQKHIGLDALCIEFNITAHDRHTAAGDAYITALLFLKIVSKWRKERPVNFDDLFRNGERRGLM